MAPQGASGCAEGSADGFFRGPKKATEAERSNAMQMSKMEAAQRALDAKLEEKEAKLEKMKLKFEKEVKKERARSRTPTRKPMQREETPPSP